MPSNFQPLPQPTDDGSGTVIVDGEVEIVNDPSSPVPVVGTVDIGNFPATPASTEIANDVGNPIPTNVVNDPSINKYGPGIRQTRVFTVSAAGDNIIVTPSVGKIRVYWVGYSSSESNTMEVLASLRFGNGPDIYGWYLGAPGAFSHWEPITGDNGDSLIINLSVSQPIQVNITFEEILD